MKHSYNIFRTGLYRLRLVTTYRWHKLRHSLTESLPKLYTWFSQQSPATHQRLSPLEFWASFAHEFVLLSLALIALFVNIWWLKPWFHEYHPSQVSYSSQFLNSHSQLNPKLIAKQSTIKTQMVDANPFFNQALADQVNPENGNLPFDGITDNTLLKNNPDSVQKLVSRQVKIYETKPTDTVYSVAEQFGVSPQTIRWTNSLPNNALKAGWFLIIPPVDGIVVQIKNPNLTLADVAGKYNTKIDDLIAYNGLENAEDMPDLGDYLIVPNGTPPTPPKPVTPPAKPTKAFKPFVPEAASISGNHRFAPGYCTDYVARKVPGITWGGNANRWIANSKAAGATVNRTPKAGSILVTNENSRYGHVAYIEKVIGSTVYISEWNYAGLYTKTERALEISDPRIKGIIHVD